MVRISQPRPLASFQSMLRPPDHVLIVLSPELVDWLRYLRLPTTWSKNCVPIVASFSTDWTVM
jgi:hypothetical protein